MERRFYSSAVRRSSAVTLDPHHQAILDALDGKLDPEVFEECARALLRREWPSLVSVRGGADDGFDGAVAAPAGEPFPLAVTTGEKLVDNLADSLDQAKSRYRFTDALFATSRRITPSSRGKLFAAARKRGVTLRQTYDQEWFAQCLYREPEWCLRLLGVTGRPAALSLFPMTHRPLFGDDLLGRERERDWLLKQKGDCLLVGEPGSGKTFLLRSLALQGHARFLVDDDRAQIANDLRSLRPEAVIVDDAHVNPEQITTLDQIRSEVGATFRIIATSWPGAADTVRSTIKVGSTNAMQLDRIDADTMVEIIKSFGIHGPDRLLYIIRKQAAGRPGLAATLTHLCRSGNMVDVVRGESLVAELDRSLGQVMGTDAMRLLAPFALGGAAGVKLPAVSTRLEKSQFDVRADLAKLGAAGVVRERSDRAISVEPKPMRWVIVKRVFFDGPGALDIEPFLDIVESRHDALHSLMGARSCGAAIPDLTRLLEDADDAKLWSGYAALGAAESRYVLCRHPELIEAVARPTLRNAPETAIPMLLDRMRHQHAKGRSERPIDRLKSWANRDTDDIEFLFGRRLTLVRETLHWWERNRDGQLAIHVLCVALMPVLEYRVSDPGIGNTVSYMSRMLRDDELRKLASYWPAVLKIVRESERVPWNDLFKLVTVLIQPQSAFFPPVKYGPETGDILHKLARTMLVDLASITRQHPGLQHRIAGLAERTQITLKLNLDPVFEVLAFSVENWECQRQAWSDAIGKLANSWKDGPLEDVASLLKWCEVEAHLGGIKGPRLSYRFCIALAELVSDPIAAADALICRSISSASVAPFLRKAASNNRPGWARLTGHCLAEEEYRWIAVQTVLVHRSPPRDLLDAALSAASDMPDLDGFLNTACPAMAEATVREMLQSNVPRIAVAASIGYWLGHQGRIKDAIRTPWRQAILRSALGEDGGSYDGYRLGEILSKDSDLSVEWLVSNQIDADQSVYWECDLANTVARSLGTEQRKRVLERLADADEIRIMFDVIKSLVGGDIDLYHQLLDSEALKRHHLDPLHCASDWRESETLKKHDNGPLVQPLDATWRKLALAALDHGYSTQKILDATIGAWSWSGPVSEMWAVRRRGFEALMNDPEDRIAGIGRGGVEYTKEREQDAIRKEMEEAVEGLQ